MKYLLIGMALILGVSLVGNGYLYRELHLAKNDLEEETKTKDELQDWVNKATPIMEKVGDYLNSEEKIDGCLQNALDEYHARWKRNCITEGKELNENDSCALPKEKAQYFDKKLEEEKEFCLKRYQ